MITAILRKRFIFGVPLLSSAIAPFDGLEHRFALQKLVKRFLPEERAAIMGLGPVQAGRYFIACFSKKYFPIALGEESYHYLQRLTSQIPLSLKGFDADNYEPGWRGLPSGQLLAETLCVNPCDEPDYDAGCHIGRLSAARPGNRLTVLDEFGKVLGEDAAPLLKLIPEGGFTLEEIERALAGEEIWQGLLARCRWLFRKTGNAWYDNPPRQEIQWSRDNVIRFTRDWPGAQQIKKVLDSLDSWLGHHRNERMAEVINHVRAHVPKRLMEVFNGQEA